jgi:hypothetical protein
MNNVDQVLSKQCHIRKWNYTNKILLLCLKAHWQFDSDIVYPYCDALETKLNEERPIASVNREKETVAIIEFDVRLFII